MNVTPFEPIGVVKVLRGVNIDSAYTDTYYFNSAQEQEAFFNSKVKFAWSDFTPIRLEQAIAVPVVADLLYDCTYIMFQNKNFANKWFYAFIKKIEYINPNMSKIYFELDVMQTWFFDYQLAECFVVRQHSATDEIGENLVDENLELGEYISNYSKDMTDIEDYSIIVAATVDDTGKDSVGGMYSGIYSGLTLIPFNSPDVLNTFIDTLVTQNKGNSIVSIFMMPKVFVQNKGTNSAKIEDFEIVKRYDNIDGYVPTNKKLFTYPYNFLCVTNYAGTAANFRYEFFNTDNFTCKFILFGDMSSNPSVIMCPELYKGQAINYNEKIVLDGFPQCAWTTDTYKAWLAQNGSATQVSMLGSAFSGVASLLSGNIGGAVSQGFGIATELAKIKATESLPPQAHGAAGNSAMIAISKKTFGVFQMSITREYAQIIDDYFTMYGYADHRVTVPLRNSRKSFNYVQTKNCHIVGSVAFDDAEKIKSIYDKGITFWHGDFIGQYFRDNSPV